MAEKIDRAVGMPQSIQKPPNKAADQAKIIKLLAAIATNQGGKKDEWGTAPLNGPDGQLPGHIGDAIWAFQRFWKDAGVFNKIDGVVDPGGRTLRKMNQLASGALDVFFVHDARLFGWRPPGDGIEVNADTPLSWVIDTIIRRGAANSGNMVVQFMSHGVPGFLQCARGASVNPAMSDVWDNSKTPPLFIGRGPPGIGATDLPSFAKLAGYVRRIEFHSCLVARMGPCPEWNATCYDGNSFCFRLAKVTEAQVKASIHLQYYWGEGGAVKALSFGQWNGRVFTWGPGGNIIKMEDFPYNEPPTTYDEIDRGLRNRPVYQE